MSHLYLAIPDTGSIYCLHQRGKERVSAKPLGPPLSFKYGPHLINVVCAFEIEPQDININYYDGGNSTYDLLHSCLMKPEQLARFRTDGEDFGTALQELSAIFDLTQPAVIYVKCDMGGIFRLKFHPEEGLQLTQIETPVLFDECRQADYQQLYAHATEQHRLRMERLLQMFNPHNQNVGSDTFADLLKHLN